ncbi:MAG: hypothetical protein HIU91_13430 [Acidobacteria bacterium]|nr:hypothetical protein [Acidobacteriota bacterium]
MELNVSPELKARLNREQQERDELARRNFATLDHAALLKLRPGMSEANVAAVLGELWKPRVPRDEGFYFGLSAAGFTLRMDTSGHIGSISLHRAGELSLEGLRQGMSKADVLALYPNLRELPSDNEYGYTSWEVPLPDGQLLSVRFDKDSVLVGISIKLPSAKYHTGKERIVAPRGKYTKPAGKPGAPFADPNLKLAVLDELMRTGHLDLGTPQDLADHVLKRTVDLDQEGYDLLQPVYKYLARYPLSQQQLGTITKLTFDGGLKIYEFVYPFWDGESDEFDIHSFVGIEHCPNLRDVHIISMVADDAGVEPLQARLSQLRSQP